MKFNLTLALAVGSLFCGVISAAPIPYSNPGTQNPDSYSFTATNTGDIVAYFNGSGASYNEVLGLEVNGVATGITGLNDQSSSIGQSLNLGHANAGDTLTFFINVADSGSTWYSNAALNSDGANHVYSTAFAATTLIPTGTYVGFEDLTASLADFNYTDEQFVFTNTSTNVSDTPEPASFALCGLAVAGFGLVRRRMARPSVNL